MNAKKMYSTSLVWHHRSDGMPDEGNRVVVFSPSYDRGDPMKIRIMDSQFYRSSIDAEWWAYINTPN